MGLMAGPLLESKLHIPARRPGAVSRPRLNERLRGASRSALTVLSAPAGFGKTTLLTEWLATVPADEASIAWLSLDQRDNEPTLYWTYVVAALQTAADGVGASALNLLQSPQTPSEATLAVLLNDLHTVPNDIVLVLDDYHLIEAGEVQDGMAFLLDHLPPQLHLVLATRADPALALARMRARGQLLEVRAADLRFTPEESAAYLNGAMGLALTSQDVAALDGRTEGWIAALQLAALSMQGRDDASSFIAGFAGDDRYVVDYLAEEVLERQPAQVRDFLLRTSILDRLSGRLCDAVTGQDGGRAALVALERANLFLVPLDGRREWYRYHHLFSDVLQAHLMQEYADEIPELHRRASGWFEQHGESAEAIDHALAAADFPRAAELMELAIPVVRRDRRERELRRWVEMLPDEVVRVRPVLGIFFAGALAQVSEFDTVGSRLSDIERSLGVLPGGTWPKQPPSDVLVVDLEEFQRLPGTVELYRAALALAVGDLDGTIAHARQAMSLAPPDDDLTRAASAALGGLASWSTGDLASAYQGYAEAIAGLGRVGFVSDVLGCSITLADIRQAQGRLDEAMSTFQRGLGLAAVPPGLPPLRGTADMHVGLANVLLERNDLPAAAEHLTRSQQLGEHNGLPQNPYRWRVTMARLRSAEGDLDAALELLNEADRVYAGDYSPNVRPVPAVRARLWVKQGRLSDALGWARQRGLSVNDDLAYLHEFEHITLARLLIARHITERATDSLDEATRLLGRLLAAAEAGDRTGTVLEILLLQALAHQARGDTAAGLAPLHRAVTLAEPVGYVRIFADEGAPMAALLKALSKQATAPRYVRRLLAATSRIEHHRPVAQPLVEPLSEREFDVLRLLGTDLDGPDIARELSVSLNTMRTHTRNIYAKLGVTSRRDAVRQAHELDLLPGPRHR